MQKRSHKLLAATLLENTQGFQARRFELAFLFGSFQPDCNPLTYLKGSLRAYKFRGHNYSNSQHYIYSINLCHVAGLQLRITSGHYHKSTGMLLYQTMNGLPAFFIRHLRHRTGIYHTDICFLSFARSPDSCLTQDFTDS